MLFKSVLAMVAACVLSPCLVLASPSSPPHLQRISQSQPYRTRRWLSSEPDAVRLDRLHVESRLQYRYAHTLVTSTLTNTANTSQQAKFSLLLPESAFITGFNLEVGGKVYKSFIRERQKAKHQYQQAIDNGLTAGHLAVSARDSNHFYISVNLEAESRATFNLTYEQLLSRKLGLYHHVINLHPGQVVGDLRVSVHISEPVPLTRLSVPPFRTGHPASAAPSDKENRLWEGVVVERPSRKKAVVVFMPSPSTQQRLSVVEGEGLAGQLVVQYDVDNQSPAGTILTNEGYFVHTVAPEDLPPLRKHAIFTLDVSGSMTGRKLAQLKEAMSRILDDLDPADYFNIIEFSYAVTVWDLESPSASAVIQPELHSSGLWWYNKAELPSTAAPTPSRPYTVPPYPATADYIQKAKELVEKMTAGGGTNIHGALKTAMLAASASTLNTTSGTNSTVEPIIIFLTDGDPTIGITDPQKILNMVKELNVKQNAIFSLAFGDGADLSFLRRLSLANNGFARNIYEAADAALQLRNFYSEVASPLLANVTFSYLPGQVVRSSLTLQNFHTLFLGSQVVVAGRLEPQADTQLTGTVTALTADGPAEYQVQASSDPIDELSADLYSLWSAEDEGVGAEERKRRKKKKVKGTLERLWAFLTIQQLLEQRQVSDSEDTRRKVLDLALKYNFVTPMTSLVVIKPNQSVEIDQDSLKPQSLRNHMHPSDMFLKTRPGPLRPYLAPTTSFLEESSTNRVVSLERLSVDDLQWEGLVDRENGTITLPLGVNGTNQQYRLGLDQEDWPHGECVSPLGSPSQCRHLPHCVLSDILASVTSYIRYYCPLPNGFAGICCPDLQTEPSTTTERAETTTGDTTPFDTTLSTDNLDKSE